MIKSMLIGRHNVQNALAAAGLARSLGVGLGAIESGLAAVCTIPGRLQRVPGIRGFDVFVDYAHTPDALRSAASVLRPVTCGRLIVVFGCGGDRDRGKRPLMARVAAEFADAMIVTSDNPRGEDPQRIIDDALAGIDGEAGSQGGARVSPVVRVEGDRRRAIVDAIDSAREGDVVLIAGKGHEDYQIVGNERLHFDDVEVAMEAGRAGRNAGVA